MVRVVPETRVDTAASFHRVTRNKRGRNKKKKKRKKFTRRKKKFSEREFFGKIVKSTLSITRWRYHADEERHRKSLFLVEFYRSSFTSSTNFPFFVFLLPLISFSSIPSIIILNFYFVWRFFCHV